MHTALCKQTSPLEAPNDLPHSQGRIPFRENLREQVLLINMGFITPELEKIFIAHISKPVTFYRACSGSYHAKPVFP